MRILFCVLSLWLWSLASPALELEGALIADNGFRPKPDGFQFANWGAGGYPQGRLDAEDVRYLFGDRVCAYIENDTCEPTPAAAAWIESMNQVMQGGHCEGMAALSAAFFQEEEQAKEYGGNTPYVLAPDEDVLHAISTYFTTQFLEPVNTEAVETLDMSLEEIISTLAKALNKGEDYYTLGIYSGRAGHALTPFAVERLDGDEYRIHVYDNNYPGVEKYIEVDTADDRWHYAAAALNPDEDSEPWEGESGDMDLTRLSSRYEPLFCPFCDEEEENGEGYQSAGEESQESEGKPPLPFSFAGLTATAGKFRNKFGSQPQSSDKPVAALSALIAADCDQVEAHNTNTGETLKIWQGHISNKIKGARLQRIRGSRGCFMSLPAAEYQVSLHGREGGGKTSISFFRRGQVFRVSDLQTAKGQTEGFEIGGSLLRYTAGGHSNPRISLSVNKNRSDGAAYVVEGAALEAGRSFFIGIGADRGQVSFHEDGEKPARFSIQALHVQGKKRETFSFKDVDAKPGESVIVELKKVSEKLKMYFKSR